MEPADKAQMLALLDRFEAGPSKDRAERRFSAYDRHGVRGDEQALRTLLGREPRTLPAYLDELLWTSGPNPMLLRDN